MNSSVAKTEGRPRALFDKVWDQHVVVAGDDGRALLFIDRHFVHEGSFHAFDQLTQRGDAVARSDLTFGIADHYVPTRDRSAGAQDAATQRMIDTLTHNTAAHGIDLFGLNDRRQGIVHVAGPEQGLTLPGLTIVCGDSHTSTHGAFGAVGFGIGASEVAHVLATQTLWQRKPNRMLIRVEGNLGPGVGAKDIALSIIARIGANGAQGHAIEFSGSAIVALSMEARMTLCNMAIEAGARCGMIAPDETTLRYLRDRPMAPKGAAFDKAAEDWLGLASDVDTAFDAVVDFDSSDIAPTVTWGTSPEDALPVTGRVPDPGDVCEAARAGQIRDTLQYMALVPGQSLSEIAIDRAFIGSCTNGRIEDLRAAAAILRGRKAVVPALVSPGSSAVRRQAEAEGLDVIFRDAGFDWVESGCSMCVGMNGDLVGPGERCASTTNRNFKGRQGPGSRTHIMSPAMVAAAAVTGRLTDLRTLERELS